MSVGGTLIEAQQLWLEAQQRRLTRQQRRIVVEAVDRLTRRLRRSRRGSWTRASLEATLAQISDAVDSMRAHQTLELRDALRPISRRAWRDTARYITELDKVYLGAARPIAWDTLDFWSGAWGPYDRARLRVYRRSMRRYGAEAVAEIEVALAQRVLVGTPWTDARDQVARIADDVIQGRQWMVDRIARTETAAAYNTTTLQALHEEDDMGKMLIATFDLVTAADSRRLHGQFRELDEMFHDPVRGRDFRAPPNRPNDRELLVGWSKEWGSPDRFAAQLRGEQRTRSAG